MVRQRLRRRLGKWAPTADCGDSAVGLNNISLATQQESLVLIADKEQRLEVTQEFVRAPVFCQLHCGATDVAMVLLKL